MISNPYFLISEFLPISTLLILLVLVPGKYAGGPPTIVPDVAGCSEDQAVHEIRI